MQMAQAYSKYKKKKKVPNKWTRALFLASTSV